MTKPALIEKVVDGLWKENFTFYNQNWLRFNEFLLLIRF